MAELLKQALQTASSHPRKYIQTRAQIILLTLTGKSIESIRQEVGVTAQTVEKWQTAWAEEGIAIFPEEIRQLVETSTSSEISTPLSPESIEAKLSPKKQKPPKPAKDFRHRLNLEIKGDLTVQSDDPMWEAGRKLLLQNLNELLIEEKNIWDGEPIEGVHQVRVALRRMRSIFDIFGQYFGKNYYADIYTGLRKTSKRLGEVRDLDVFLLKTQVYIDNNLEDDVSDLKDLLELLTDRHRRAQKAMHKWLKQENYDRFIQDFHELLSVPGKGGRKKYLRGGHPPLAYQVKHVVPRLIYEQMEAIWAYEPFLATAEATLLHELRIEFKRLRYLLEFFEDVLGDDIGVVIKATRKMQNYLGNLNDADVAITLLTKLKDDLPSRSGVKKYIKFRRQEHDELYENFGAIWEEFNHVDIHRALASAIAEL